MARTGSPTTAAMQLKVDHTTVRRRIDALEDSLKVKLFEPRDRGILLTNAGNRLLATAESIEALAAGAEESVSGKDLSLSGMVRIGVPDGLGEIGRANVGTPVTNAHLVFRLLLEKTKELCYTSFS